MKTLGLVSNKITATAGVSRARDLNVNYETDKLIAAALDREVRVMVINPRDLMVETLPEGKFRVMSNGHDISEVDYLLARSTAGVLDNVLALVTALEVNGCTIVDGKDVFSRGPSKLLTTLNRHKNGVGSKSWVLLGRDSADNLRHMGIPETDVIAKPIKGGGGKGVKTVETADDIESMLSERDYRILLQTKEPMENEYRAIVFRGRVLDAAKKIPEKTSLAANVALGGKMVALDEPTKNSIKEYVEQSVTSKALLGVDVGERDDGNLFILEENRAPQWQAFDSACGTDIADKVMALVVGK